MHLFPGLLSVHVHLFFLYMYICSQVCVVSSALPLISSSATVAPSPCHFLPSLLSVAAVGQCVFCHSVHQFVCLSVCLFSLPAIFTVLSSSARQVSELAEELSAPEVAFPQFVLNVCTHFSCGLFVYICHV